MSQVDFKIGYRYADEVLEDRQAHPLDVMLSGLPKWKRVTAESLIQSANQRKAEGVNLSYQEGVIARADKELQP